MSNPQPEPSVFTEACRRYCGSYRLVEHTRDGRRFRVRGETPLGYREVAGAYDDGGFLRDEFWSLPRMVHGIVNV